MHDLSTVQALIDAHQAAMERFDASPDGTIPDDVVTQMDTTAAALCAYRPATLEGVHIKAGYMISCFVFVGGEGGDAEFTRADLISGFLPAPTA
ncbi:hypothetical protein ABIE78_006392 [Sinorhizobium fredii]|uniref:hypothetical protein n=1 Tax=Rhizobium fredii TaxID=380 RepID=UPI0002DA3F8B|nr:hypothetical protein [Sinorhizobium fredii]